MLHNLVLVLNNGRARNPASKTPNPKVESLVLEELAGEKMPGLKYLQERTRSWGIFFKIPGKMIDPGCWMREVKKNGSDTECHHCLIMKVQSVTCLASEEWPCEGAKGQVPRQRPGESRAIMSCEAGVCVDLSK